ncbi:hypothetical protein SS1G_07142 [Sclerotinia sclerotiorum 1980 UF-70]|uniref:Uncharacterized protein n=1 Tax=Sclerotinia sclerotiorum (strain ATCC 18683 / 1980 / Ss-1) TaxID=665079 RepID=A7EP93_SCLS1|nr:hypothetical protein SS1G_07142 [Sclerotinia sclerotiorum 1980 UF-70]EDO04659.1 hypothetical protein SS1G_07142 [Sclerotinia sclerotiorum 1980 UF-70]
MSQTQREVILITGANTGLGFEIVKSIYASERAYDIILGGRSLAKIEDAIDCVTKEMKELNSKLYPLVVDIEHDDAIARAFEEVKEKFGKLDVLVNNAGAQLDQRLTSGEMSEREMWNKSWDINVSGSQIMTSTFMPLLLSNSVPNPRLLFIASGTSSLGNTTNMNLPPNKYSAKGWPKKNFDGKNFNVPAYRSAKTGLNMMMREWYRALHEDGVKVWAVSPGWLATGLGRIGSDSMKGMGAIEPWIGGAFVRGVVEGERDADVGMVIVREGVQVGNAYLRYFGLCWFGSGIEEEKLVRSLASYM